MDNKQMGILGMVLSIFVGPIGIIFSAIALSKMNQTGETDGKEFAIAGLVIGIAYIAVVILAIGCVACGACAIIAGATAGGAAAG